MVVEEVHAVHVVVVVWFVLVVCGGAMVECILAIGAFSADEDLSLLL